MANNFDAQQPQPDEDQQRMTENRMLGREPEIWLDGATNSKTDF